MRFQLTSIADLRKLARENGKCQCPEHIVDDLTLAQGPGEFNISFKIIVRFSIDIGAFSLVFGRCQLMFGRDRLIFVHSRSISVDARSILVDVHSSSVDVVCFSVDVG